MLADDGHGYGSTINGKDGEEKLVRELNILMCQHGVSYAFDDVSNAALDPSLVKKARALEMKSFDDMGVYSRVPRSEVARCNGTLIKTRWIDVTKWGQRQHQLQEQARGEEV